MPQIPPNQATAKAAPCIGKARTRYSVKGIPNLQLDVTRGGSRTWYAQFRDGAGRRTVVKIGPLSEISVGQAADRARALLGEQKLTGIDPRTARMTFGDLYAEWLKEHSEKRNRASTRLSNHRIYSRYIEPALGHVLLTDLGKPIEGKRRVLDALGIIGKGTTGIQKGKCQVLLTTICRWGTRTTRLATNPADLLPSIEKPKVRGISLTDDELRLLWNADFYPAMKALIRTLMLTGMRVKEASRMMKTDVNLDLALSIRPDQPNGAAWRLPAADDLGHGDIDRASKNGHAHIVPLSPFTVAVFRAAVEASPSEWVFTAPRTGLAIDPKEVSHIARDVDRNGTWTMHSLRNTMTTRLAALGVSEEMSERAVNYISRRSIGGRVYNQHTFFAEKAKVFALWEAELLRIVG